MLARFFIDRPIFAWVLSLVIILVGLAAAAFLPMDLYPPITPPTVQVTASYPGADAQTVANVIGAPIEQQVIGVERMMYMSSQSTNDGNYALTVTFEIGTDPNIAQVLVQNRVALALPQLPAQVQLQGVSTIKTLPNILLAVNLYSPHGEYSDLYVSNYASIHIQDEISRLTGVGYVHPFGQRLYSMRIWLDPEKLAARNLTATDVVTSIQQQNVQVAAGAVGQQPVPPGQQLQLPLTALGRLESEEQFGNIVIKTGAPTQSTPSSGAGPTNPGTAASASGSTTASGTSTAGGGTTSQGAQPPGIAPLSASGNQPQPIVSTPVVRVRDVAVVQMGAQNDDQTSKLDGIPATGLAISQLPGSNALDVANAIKQRMKELSADFPPGLQYQIVYDTTPFIRQSVDDVFRTLVEAVVLVALVVLFFLQDWKAMILPMIDVPVSLVGTLAVLAVLGFSLNNLTLFGLVLAIGIVVDDAIVVLENIERLIATGLDARTATIQAMDELTGPIVAITLVLCSVFLPSIFMPGLTGQFYRQFAVTIAVAMLISAINAMTLTPSRAVTIFRTEETGQGHEHKKEALPWWIFGVIGGVISIVYLRPHLGGFLGLPADPSQASTVVYWATFVAAFIPGAIVGGAIGWFIIGPVNKGLGWVFGGFNWIFDKITDWYGRAVGRLLRLSAIVAIVYLGLLVLTGWRVISAPKGFIPTQDQGYLLVNVQLPDAASVQRTDEVMNAVAKIAHETPGVAHTVQVAGTSFLLGTNGSNLGSMFVVLKPWDERGGNEYDAVVAGEIQRRAAQEIKGAIVSAFRAPPIRGIGNVGGLQMQIEQHGFVDLQKLQTQTDELVRRANSDPAFAGAFTLYRANTPQLYVDIDRTKVEALQVPIPDVFETLTVEMGGLYVNQINLFGRTWEVQVEAAAPFRTTDQTIRDLQVRNSQQQMVPLGTVAHVKRTTGPIFVMRYNEYASAAVNANTAPGVSTGDAIQNLEKLARDAGLQYEWTQMSYLEVRESNVAMYIFAFGTIMVYFVLAAKYESWRLPLAVILVVPLCMLAAVTGMTIASLPVDIFVQIGLLVLVGLASKNAILIVEYARQLHVEGKGIFEAAVQASRIRFRPILMTSFAFIFGVLPLVLATGAGAEMRQSLGIAVFSGMVGVTLFGIFLTPVFYYSLMWFGDRSQRRRQAQPSLLGEPEERRGSVDPPQPDRRIQDRPDQR